MGAYNAVLKIRFPKDMWDDAKVNGYTNQFLLLFALERSGITPWKESTKEAYAGAKAF